MVAAVLRNKIYFSAPVALLKLTLKVCVLTPLILTVPTWLAGSVANCPPTPYRFTLKGLRSLSVLYIFNVAKRDPLVLGLK